MCLFLQKNEMEKEYMKLQEAHEGQQALLQKLQVRSFRKQLREDLISKGRKEIQTSTRFASRLSKMWPLLDVAKFLSPPPPPPPPPPNGKVVATGVTLRRSDRVTRNGFTAMKNRDPGISPHCLSVGVYHFFSHALLG